MCTSGTESTGDDFKANDDKAIVDFLVSIQKMGPKTV